MIEYLRKITEKEKCKLLLQFVKFCLVGVSNTVVSYVLYAGIIFLLHDLSWQQDYIFANVTSFTLSILWAYYWNNKYVFKEEDTGKRKMWKALGKCFLVYGFSGYILDNVLSYIWIQRLGFSRYIAPLFNLPFSVPVNYLLNKLWVFRDEPRESMFSKSEKIKLGQLIIWALLAVLCLFVAAKVIFIGYSADEEYQLVLTYRLARGDMLFREVWDTLQTSAFYGQFFMWLYLKVMHTTTGCLLFLRLCGVVTQGCVSLFLFFTLKKYLKFDSALFLSTAFFCTYTKLVAMPEFSNMQTWSLIIMLCAIWRAKDTFESGKKKKGYLYLSAAALFFCVAVLSTACVILIPAVLLLLFRLQEKGGMKRNLLFWGICLFCGTAYVLALLAINGLDTLLFGINGVLTGDDTHLGGVLLNGNQKWAEYLQDAGIIIAYMAVTLLIAIFVSFVTSLLTKKRNDTWMLVWIVEAYVVTLYNWFVKKIGYEGLKLYIPVLSVIGIYVFFRHFHSTKNNQAQRSSMLPAFYGIVIGIGAFANVLLISNVGITWNITFLNTSALWGMVILVSYLEKNDDPINRCLISRLFCLMMIVGTGFTLNAGPIGSTIFDIERNGRMQEGPTKGTLVSNNVAYIYDVNFRLFDELVKDDSNVLIVTNFFHNQSLTPMYMLNDVDISHYTVNSTPTYSDKLYEYWERYPERMPDCIIINGDSCSHDDYLWALDLISKYDDLVEVTLYNIRYFVRPECVKETYFSN